MKQIQRLIFTGIFFCNIINCADKSSLPTGIVAGTIVFGYLGYRGMQYTNGFLEEKALIKDQIVCAEQEALILNTGCSIRDEQFRSSISRYLPNLTISWHEKEELRNTVKTNALQSLNIPQQTVEDFFESNGITATYKLQKKLTTDMQKSSKRITFTPKRCAYILNALTNWELTMAHTKYTKAYTQAEYFIKGTNCFIELHKEAVNLAKNPLLVDECRKKFTELDFS